MCVELPVRDRPVCPYLPPPLCALTVGSRVVRLCADISHTHAEIPGNQNDEIGTDGPVRPTTIDGSLLLDDRLEPGPVHIADPGM